MESVLQDRRLDTISFKRPGSTESHQERFNDQPQDVKHTIYTFKSRGDWFNPSTQAFGSAFQLATEHPIYGTSLRIYDYLGTVKDRGKTHYAFITEQTSGGNGPRRTGRHWASGAISIPVSNDGRYVNPAQICLIERNDKDPEIFGSPITQGDNYTDTFRKDLKITLKHFADDHPGLHEALCGIYLSGVGGDRWQRCMKTIWRLLQFDQLEGNAEHCKLQNCFLLHELRMAWADNFLMTMPPPTLASEASGERFERRRGKDKIKPSHNMCNFLTGRMIIFDAAKHRIEWAHATARTPLPLEKPQA